MPGISHRARIEKCLSGVQPDRTPVALWRHFPVDDQTPQGLAAATIHFQQVYDFDLVKVTPASSFCLRDWGASDAWNGNTEGTRDYTYQVIQSPGDWSKLPLLDPRKGWLGGQLKCLKLIQAKLGPETPILQSIFSPLAQAKNLVGAQNLAIHLRKYPQELHSGLKIIAESTTRFINEVQSTGIAGIFYAVQHASLQLMSAAEFESFGRAYDLKVLEAAKSMWLNMLHIHGENILFDAVTDYPVQVINWHDRHTPPSLEEAQMKYKGLVCGGLRRWETMVTGSSRHVEKEAREAIQATGGKRFILGTGCVLPIIAPHGNIAAARQSVDRGKGRS